MVQQAVEEAVEALGSYQTDQGYYSPFSWRVQEFSFCYVRSLAPKR